MQTYEQLPTQARANIDECVIAMDAGGKALGARTFKAISDARELTVAETVMLGACIRRRLASLGMLTIG